MINAYVKEYGEYGFYNLVPYEKYNWTGNIKFEVIDGRKTIYVERFIMFFGLIPLWKTWVDDEDIVFRDEEITIYGCQ